MGNNWKGKQVIVKMNAGMSVHVFCNCMFQQTVVFEGFYSPTNSICTIFIFLNIILAWFNYFLNFFMSLFYYKTVNKDLS